MDVFGIPVDILPGLFWLGIAVVYLACCGIRGIFRLVAQAAVRDAQEVRQASPASSCA